MTLGLSGHLVEMHPSFSILCMNIREISLFNVRIVSCKSDIAYCILENGE